MWVLYLIIVGGVLVGFWKDISGVFKKAPRWFQKQRQKKLAQKQQLLLKASLQESVRDLWITSNGNSDWILTQFSENQKTLVQQLLEEIQNGSK